MKEINKPKRISHDHWIAYKAGISAAISAGFNTKPSQAELDLWQPVINSFEAGYKRAGYLSEEQIELYFEGSLFNDN